jgi:hypothetical protein
MDQSHFGNDLGLGNNYQNMQNNQNMLQNNQNPVPQVSSPTDVLGVISSSQKIPGWVKGIAGWWAEGKISDDEFVSAVKFLIHQGIIKV